MPPPPPGRRTKTALKAAKPLTPKSNPPTNPIHPLAAFTPQDIPTTCYQPIQPFAIFDDIPTQPPSDAPELFLPELNIPSISQIRDFPNLSNPLPSSVIVHLPHSAPSSPIPSPFSFLDVEDGNPVTPTNSPSEVSVILSNPNFLSVPTHPSRPRVSTPVSSQAVGSWDNFLEAATYQGLDQEFWGTRTQGSCRQVQLVSTDLSEPEDLTGLDQAEFSCSHLVHKAKIQVQK